MLGNLTGVCYCVEVCSVHPRLPRSSQDTGLSAGSSWYPGGVGMLSACTAMQTLTRRANI